MGKTRNPFNIIPINAFTKFIYLVMNIFEILLFYILYCISAKTIVSQCSDHKSYKNIYTSTNLINCITF